MQKKNIYLTFLVYLSLTLFQQAAIAQPAESGNASKQVSLLVQVNDSKGKRPKTLLPEMLKLVEGEHERKILSIEEETRPLSLVLVINLGIDPYCGFTNLGQLLGWLNTSLDATLTSADEVAAIVTHEKGVWAFQFADSQSKRREMLGNDSNLKGEITKWNGQWGEPEVMDVGKPIYYLTQQDQVNFESVNIVVQQKNSLGAATQKAIQYLLKNKRKESRPVILFVNSLHNVVDQDVFLQEIINLTAQPEVLVGWIGQRVAGEFQEFVRGAPWDKIKTGNLEIFSLKVKKMGGEVVSCEDFSPRFSKKKQYQMFTQHVTRLITNLRTRYKITYESDNPFLTQPRNIKLEMSPKWKGGKVTLHYPQVIYPQANGK